MSSKNHTKYIEGKCSESPLNKLDKPIEDQQIRQYNCPPCAHVDKSSCQIPAWITRSCDDMKCFNCPPKCLFGNLLNSYENVKQKSNEQSKKTDVCV